MKKMFLSWILVFIYVSPAFSDIHQTFPTLEAQISLLEQEMPHYISQINFNRAQRRLIEWTEATGFDGTEALTLILQEDDYLRILRQDSAPVNHSLFLLLYLFDNNAFSQGDVITPAIALAHSTLFSLAAGEAKQAILEDILEQYVFYREILDWQDEIGVYYSLRNAPLIPKILWADRSSFLNYLGLYYVLGTDRFDEIDLSEYREYVDSIDTLRRLNRIIRENHLVTHSLQGTAASLEEWVHTNRFYVTTPFDILLDFHERGMYPDRMLTRARDLMAAGGDEISIGGIDYPWNGIHWINRQYRMYLEDGHFLGDCGNTTIIQLAMYRAAGIAPLSARWEDLTNNPALSHVFPGHYDPGRGLWCYYQRPDNLAVLPGEEVQQMRHLFIIPRWHSFQEPVTYEWDREARVAYGSHYPGDITSREILLEFFYQGMNEEILTRFFLDPVPFEPGLFFPRTIEEVETHITEDEYLLASGHLPEDTVCIAESVYYMEESLGIGDIESPLFQIASGDRPESRLCFSVPNTEEYACYSDIEGENLPNNIKLISSEGNSLEYQVSFLNTGRYSTWLYRIEGDQYIPLIRVIHRVIQDAGIQIAEGMDSVAPYFQPSENYQNARVSVPFGYGHVIAENGTAILPINRLDPSHDVAFTMFDETGQHQYQGFAAIEGTSDQLFLRVTPPGPGNYRIYLFLLQESQWTYSGMATVTVPDSITTEYQNGRFAPYPFTNSRFADRGFRFSDDSPGETVRRGEDISYRIFGSAGFDIRCYITDPEGQQQHGLHRVREVPGGHEIIFSPVQAGRYKINFHSLEDEEWVWIGYAFVTVDDHLPRQGLSGTEVLGPYLGFTPEFDRLGLQLLTENAGYLRVYSEPLQIRFSAPEGTRLWPNVRNQDDTDFDDSAEFSQNAGEWVLSVDALPPGQYRVMISANPGDEWEYVGDIRLCVE